MSGALCVSIDIKKPRKIGALITSCGKPFDKTLGRSLYRTLIYTPIATFCSSNQHWPLEHYRLSRKLTHFPCDD